MRIIRNIARILLGMTFVFSGFTKGIDPLGSAYKFTDYFMAFGIPWASQLSLVLSILLSLAEFAIGAALLFNFKTKLASWGSFIFMLFFLPLTLYLAVKNPVTDCGCFGDALVISNWATFYKNVVLMLLAIIVLANKNKFTNKLHPFFAFLAFAIFVCSYGFVVYYSFNHLPIIDFRPYKIGKNITEGMTIPEGAQADVYKYDFTYRNKTTGNTEQFDEKNYPWADTLNWEFVDMQPTLLKKGYVPPIHDFTIENEMGDDVADFFLGEPTNTYILVSHDLSKFNKTKLAEINEFALAAIDNGCNFLCLTPATWETIEKFRTENETQFDFFQCDEITLKTIIRSNPGLVQLNEGTVMGKWHWKDFPTFEDAENNSDKK